MRRPAVRPPEPAPPRHAVCVLLRLPPACAALASRRPRARAPHPPRLPSTTRSRKESGLVLGRPLASALGGSASGLGPAAGLVAVTEQPMMRPWRRTPRYHEGPMRFSCTSVKPAAVNHCGRGGRAGRRAGSAGGQTGGQTDGVSGWAGEVSSKAELAGAVGSRALPPASRLPCSWRPAAARAPSSPRHALTARRARSPPASTPAHPPARTPAPWGTASTGPPWRATAGRWGARGLGDAGRGGEGGGGGAGEAGWAGKRLCTTGRLAVPAAAAFWADAVHALPPAPAAAAAGRHRFCWHTPIMQATPPGFSTRYASQMPCGTWGHEGGTDESRCQVPGQPAVGITAAPLPSRAGGAPEAFHPSSPKRCHHTRALRHLCCTLPLHPPTRCGSGQYSMLPAET